MEGTAGFSEGISGGRVEGVWLIAAGFDDRGELWLGGRILNLVV